MKTTFLTTAACLVMTANLLAQSVLAPFNPSKDDRKWGFMNEKGEEIIAPTYDEVLNFSDGVTFVRNGKEWKIINTSNEEVATELKNFTLLSIFGFGKRGFSDGYAAIIQSKKVGVINAQGKLVHPCKYTTVSDFNDGVATARLGKDFYIIDGEGNSTAVPDVLALNAYSGGLIPFRAKNKLFGYMDNTGKITIPATYKSVGYFVNDVAWVKNTDGTINFINKSGSKAFEGSFLAAKEFDKAVGVARVKSGDQWTFVRKSGETFSPSGATGLGDFSDGLAYAKQGDKVGFVNAKGEWAVEAKFDKVRDFNGGFAAVRVGEKWGVINKKGAFVCDPNFDDIKDFTIIK